MHWCTTVKYLENVVKYNQRQQLYSEKNAHILGEYLILFHSKGFIFPSDLRIPIQWSIKNNNSTVVLQIF